MPISRGKDTGYVSNLSACNELVLQAAFAVPRCFAPVFGWLFGPSLGLCETRDPETNVVTKKDGQVLLTEFGVTAYQNENLRAVAQAVVKEVAKAFPDESCKLILEKGSGPHRETVHIFVNTSLPVGVAEYAADLVEKHLTARAHALLAKRKAMTERNARKGTR
jgi:hypothetical protein